MRILRLEVENFRGVQSATLKCEPGLNVFHGPNELGKSTLVEAVRAALLVPKSAQTDSYLRWDRVGPTRVTLEFAAGDTVWRVSKKFDPPFKAKLEQQSGSTSGKFHEVANGPAVDGKLRELLRWGIAAPGGKAKPISYLVVALLGRQGEVGQILDASLVNDQDETGKLSITEALGALGSDPRVTGIVELLTARVESFFTPTEKLKQTAESPLVKLHDKWRAAEKALGELRDADAKSKLIGANVVGLQADWLLLSGHLTEAAATLESAQRQRARGQKKDELQTIIDECRATLARAGELSVRLFLLRAQLDEAVTIDREQRTSRDANEAALNGVAAQVQAALHAVVRAEAARDQAALEDQSSRQQRRAVLIELRSAVEGRLRDVDAAVASATSLATVESDLQDATRAFEAAHADTERAAVVLDHAKWSAERGDLAERDASARQLQSASEDARHREEGAATDLTQAEAALAVAESYRQSQAWSADQSVGDLEAELGRLLAADVRLRIEGLEERVRVCESHEARRKSSLQSASRKRDEASGLEQQVVARTLPTEEQVAAWSGWEAELERGREPVAAGRATTPAAVASAAGLGVGLLAATAVWLAGAGSEVAAAAVGLLSALLIGALIWYRANRRDRVDAGDHERRRLLEERLTAEVRPALRRAGLSSLAAVEGARGELERKKNEASRLRLEAEQDDQEAARAAEVAAPLEKLRHELADLMLQDGLGSPGELGKLFDEFGDLASLRVRVEDIQTRLDTLKVKLSQESDAAVALAQQVVAQKKSRHGQIVNEAAAAKAQHDVALQRCDPARAAQLQSLIEASGLAAEAPVAVEFAAATLDRSKGAAHEASARADELLRQVASMRPAVEQHLATLGESPTSARPKAHAELDDIDAQLAAIKQPSNDVGAETAAALAVAIRTRDERNQQLAGMKANAEEAAVKASAAAEAIAQVSRQIASAEGELKAIDRAALEARLRTASEDPVFQEPDAGGLDVTAASELHSVAKARLHDCEGRLNAAKGQLHLVGGHVVAERVARQEEVVTFAREEYEDKELTERAALRLLNEIKAAEAEATSHLGRTLAGPVTEMLKELTGGRYGAVEFMPNLTAGGVVTAGARPDLSDLSVGTREQLATLIRLAIAAQLQTSLVLDDQLVHSDTERLTWFRDRLYASARDRQHQIVVFTCRPGDYLAPGVSETGDPVNVVDLTTVVEVCR